MQRITPETSIKETYKVQQSSKEKAKQDGILAENSLTFEEVFTVPCVQFGVDAQGDMAKAIEKLTDKIVAAHKSVGMPETVAEAIRGSIMNSINPYAGLSDAVKAYGLGNHPELGSNFFASAAGAPTTAKAVETVSVKL